MEISNLSNTGLIKIDQNPLQKVVENKNSTAFANVIKGYLQTTDQTVKESSEMSVKLAAGQIENIHEVTIASQKSKLALELTVAIRDKAVEAYQETMRMQI